MKLVRTIFTSILTFADSVTYEWLLENCVRSRGAALVTYEYPSDKLPDTKDDILTFGFITPSLDAVLFRVDSRGGESHNDYLQIEIVSANITHLHLTYKWKSVTKPKLHT